MIDNKSVQRSLQAKRLYSGPIDGIIGEGSLRGMRTGVEREVALPSVRTWRDFRVRLAYEQIMFEELGFYKGPVDGLDGPNTRFAMEQWQDYLRSFDVEWKSPVEDVPLQRDALAYYGKPGTNHTSLTLPYPMVLAWDLGTTIRSFPINKKAAPSARRVLEKVLLYYGEQRIKELRLDRWAGCYSNRNMRGGKRPSMHAYAAAIDFDSENNQLRWGKEKASLAGPAYVRFWQFWEEEGWVSLGRERDYDWMHVQRARL